MRLIEVSTLIPYQCMTTIFETVSSSVHLNDNFRLNSVEY